MGGGLGSGSGRVNGFQVLVEIRPRIAHRPASLSALCGTKQCGKMDTPLLCLI